MTPEWFEAAAKSARSQRRWLDRCLRITRELYEEKDLAEIEQRGAEDIYLDCAGIDALQKWLDDVADAFDHMAGGAA